MTSPITDDFSTFDQQFEADEEVPRINVDADAEEHLRCYRYHLTQHEAVQQCFDEEVGRLTNRSTAVLNRIERRQQWHLQALRAYYHHKGEKRLILANATLSNLKGRERVEVNNIEALQAWAEEEGIGGMLREKVEPDKAAILKHIKSTGEIPTGTNLVTGNDNLKVKF